MGSRGALLALTVIAAALAAAVALDRSATPSATSQRRLLADLPASAITGLRWRRPGQPEVALRRAEDGFRLMAPLAAPADGDVVDDVLARLGMLSPRRRERGRAPAEPALSLVIEREDAPPVTLAFGPAQPRLGQRWVAVDGGQVGYLLDEAAARELDRGADELRDRAVFGVAAGEVTGLELHGPSGSRVLSGRPLALHLPTGQRARLDPSRARELLAAVAGARIDRFRDEAVVGDAALRVRVLGAGPAREARVGARCHDGGWLVAAAAGVGCAHVEALVALTELDDAGAAGLIDRRVVGLEPPRVAALQRGQLRLERRSGSWAFAAGQGGARPDQAAVTAWLEAAAAITARAVEPRTAPLAGVSIRVESADGGSESLVVDPARGLARRGDEPVLLVLSRQDAALLAGAPDEFRDRQILSLEPTAVRRVTVRRGPSSALVVERGSLIDEWPPERRAAMVAFARAFARLRASRWAPGHRFTVAASLEVELDPGPDAPAVRRALELGGSARGGGCYARAGGDAFVLDAPTCQALSLER